MSIAIIIVNYKTADLTVECLRSLSEERLLEDFNVVVVDNDSQDESFEKLSTAVLLEGWSDWVTVKSSGFNGGFAYGNNFAIRELMQRRTPPDLFYLLNPDTRVHRNAVANLATFIRNNPKVGIVGSHIEDSNGKLLQASFKFHSFLTELNRGFSFGVLTKLLKSWLSSESIPMQPERVDWVSGASLMIRKSVFDDIGLLDEAYFMYFEETDFCLHASRASWECWLVPNSVVTHYVGQSSGITNTKMLKRLPTYWFNSRRRYFLKNHGVLYAMLTDFVWIVGFFSWRVRNIIQNKQHNYPPHLLWDGIKNSVFFRGWKLSPVKNK